MGVCSGGNFLPVIMAGGIGARLWPLSREDKPKQFLSPLGGRTLLQRTVERLIGGQNLLDVRTIIVVTNANFAHQTRSQLAEFHDVEFEYIFEPCVRNTAPALAAASLYVENKYPGSVIAMLAADHHVVDADAFRKALKLSCEVAEKDKSIVTFGIAPDRPETGYGYIRYNPGQGDVCDVEKFEEKPDLATAQAYLESGKYLWNSGKFVFPAKTMIEAFVQNQPDMLKSAQRSIDEAHVTQNCLYLDETHFSTCESISIDYAIMERQQNMKVVPADIGWFDVGAWEQISKIADISQGADTKSDLVHQLDSESTYVLPSNRHVVTIGTSNLVVVDTDDALLVVDRDRSQEVKTIYDGFKEAQSNAIFSSFASAPVETQQKINKKRITEWLQGSALPFWLKFANDPHTGGVIESFTREGHGQLDEPRRVRVLCRQIYAISHAVSLGLVDDASDFLMQNFDHLVKHAWRAGGGWVHKLARDNSQFDSRILAYDQAFALYAFAWLYKVTGNPAVLVQIKKTVSFVDNSLDGLGSEGIQTEFNSIEQLETKKYSMPIAEGALAEQSVAFIGNTPWNFKHANPHMHMLEAFMELYSSTGEVTYLDRAGKIVDLFTERMFDAHRCVVLELFDQEMNPVSSLNEQWIEPGHMYEWSHLLATYGELVGKDFSTYSRNLVATAETYGRSPSTNLVLGRYSLGWEPLDNTSRLWPQLERLRAMISLKNSGIKRFDEMIEESVDTIFHYYLSNVTPGLWDDCVDQNGKLISDKVPQSSFYHIMAAFAEYLDETPQDVSLKKTSEAKH